MNRITMKNKIIGLRTFQYTTKLIVALFLALSLLTGLACSKNEKAEAVILTLLPVAVAPSSAAPLRLFDEKDSQVLRCVSLIEDESKITAQVSRSKSAEIKALIFVSVIDSADSYPAKAEVACLNLEKGEGEYDMSKAFYRTVSLSSALTAINVAGLPYDDWLVGTMSQDELFPCCQ